MVKTNKEEKRDAVYITYIYIYVLYIKLYINFQQYNIIVPKLTFVSQPGKIQNMMQAFTSRNIKKIHKDYITQ